MKKILILVILAIVTGYTTQAQDRLNLSEEQSKKVEVINTEFKTGLQELKGSGASKLQKYKKYKSLQSTKDKKMKEVLTKDQFKVYKEIQAEKKEEFKNSRKD